MGLRTKSISSASAQPCREPDPTLAPGASLISPNSSEAAASKPRQEEALAHA
jgi:hypothetical protein